jgi:hypothetical protein
LLGLAVLLIAMYVCAQTLRFTNDWLNLGFKLLFFSVPLFAIRPVLHLPRKAKVWCAVVVAPMLAISLVALFFLAILDVPAAIKHVEMSRNLSTVVQGHYSVHLTWDESPGGAVGPHGVSLQQRRSIFPGVYAVRYLDYFEGASEGRLSLIGPDRVALYIPVAGYNLDQKNVQRVYSLKPWLYF